MPTYYNQQFQPESSELQVSDPLVGLIREIIVARKAWPVDEVASIEDVRGHYYKIIEENHVKYTKDLEKLDPSRSVTKKYAKEIPLISDSISYTRYERKRMARDILKMDERQRLSIESVFEKEEKVIWGGDSTNNANSIVTTGNHTDITTAIDTTTYTLAVQTLAKLKGQVRVAQKSRFAKAPLVLVVSPDVFVRFETIFSTTDLDKNILSWAKENFDEVHWTGYIGDPTGSATTTTVCYVKHRDVLRMIVSPLEVYPGENARGGIDVEFNMRSVPLVIDATGIILDESTDVTS